MKIINHFPQSAGVFLSGLVDLSPTNKIIAALAVAIFTAFATIYFVFFHGSRQKSLQVADLSPDNIPDSPVIDTTQVGHDRDNEGNTKEVLEKLSDRMEEIAQRMSRDWDDISKELDKTNQALSNTDSRLAKMEGLVLELEKKVDQLQQEKATLPDQTMQVQNDREIFTKTFNQKYCVLSNPVAARFPKGIKFDDFFADELKEVVAKYPNIRFYFSWSFGPRIELTQHFIDAVKNGTDDAMWCLVQIQEGDRKSSMYKLNFDKGVCVGQQYPYAIFRWPVGLLARPNFADNLIAVDDHQWNQRYFYETVNADLQDEKLRNLALQSTQSIKAKT